MISHPIPPHTVTKAAGLNSAEAAALLEKIRQKIEKNQVESALKEAEAFVQSFEKLDEKEKEADYDFLAEAKILLGICYGKRAGGIIAAPEEKYVAEAYYYTRHEVV